MPLRVLAAVLAAIMVGALAAQPAGASRVYAGQPQADVPNQLVLVLPEAGTGVTRLTFHIDVPCGTDFEFVDFGTTRNVSTVPTRMLGGAQYLVGGKVVGGRLSGTITGAHRVNDTTWELMNVVLRGSVGRSKAAGTMAVKVVRTDEATAAVLAQCSRTIRWSALRDPGLVYAGATSQDEPIVLELTKDRRGVRHAHVSWIAPCRSGGSWVDPHDELDVAAFPLSREAAFSRTYSFDLGRGATEIERFAGRVGPSKAAGTFQADVAIAGAGGTDTCSTGNLSWAVSTG